MGTCHCNQWGLCDALFSNYLEDLLTLGLTSVAYRPERTILRIAADPSPVRPPLEHLQSGRGYDSAPHTGSLQRRR